MHHQDDTFPPRVHHSLLWLQGSPKEAKRKAVHGASMSKQQTADLLICYGTQQDLSLSTDIQVPSVYLSGGLVDSLL